MTDNTKQQAPRNAEELATLTGRNWADCGAYERQSFEDEFRRLYFAECDCCGEKVPPDEISFIPAARAAGAGCDTFACEACRVQP